MHVWRGAHFASETQSAAGSDRCLLGVRYRNKQQAKAYTSQALAWYVVHKGMGE